MDITEEVVESVVQNISGSAGPSGTDLEALEGCILKFEDHSEKNRISAEYSVEWLENQNPP